MSNNSAQFSPCSLLPALLLASALNPRKRISQTHLSSRDRSTARPCHRNPVLFSPEEFRSKARSIAAEKVPAESKVFVATNRLVNLSKATPRGRGRPEDKMLRTSVEV